VADLISEELSRDQTKHREQQLADFEGQQQEAVRAVYEAPKRAAEALRMKRLHGPFEHPKPLDLGRVLERSWQVYRANFGMVLAVSWTAWLISAVCVAAIMGVTMGIGIVVVGLVVQSAPDIDPRWVAMPISLVGALISIIVPAWLQAGQTAWVLRLIQGRPTEFADVFREHGRIGAVVGAWIMFQLVQVMPYLAFLPVYFIGYLHQERLIFVSERVQMILRGGSGLVFLFLAAVSIAKTIRWMFFLHAIVDVQGGAGDSLENSRLIMTTRNTLLMVVAWPPRSFR
jgi:hypothetical protein